MVRTGRLAPCPTAARRPPAGDSKLRKLQRSVFRRLHLRALPCGDLHRNARKRVVSAQHLASEGSASEYEVKAGGMRVSKKQENGLVKKNAKPPGKDKTSAVVSISKIQKMSVVLAEALDKMSHKIPATALQVAHQKPQPALEKFMLPKRIYIIQQPRKC